MTIVHLAKEFLSQVRAGRKKSTIRLGIREFQSGPAILTSGNEEAIVTITTISHISFAELTDDDAKEDGFETLPELSSALRRFYPGISENSKLTVVRFRVV